MAATRTTHTGTWRALAALCAAAALWSPRSASAGDTMFRRSYFSHAIPPEMEAFSPRPVSRSAYRPALVGTTPGFGMRGVHRYNSINLRSGSSSDVTIIREDWHEVTPPFVE